MRGAHLRLDALASPGPGYQSWHVVCWDTRGSTAPLEGAIRATAGASNNEANWRKSRHALGDQVMDRRTLLKVVAGAGTLGMTGKLSTPAISQGAAARVLRFVPQANLANFDPIWGTQYVVRNASAMVWDTLYGFDEKLQPQRQMVESEETSSDGLTWTFRLRPGLKFHDGEPVRAKDVVASLARWSNRDPMGLMIKAIQNELTAVDDKTFKWVLKQPYPKMLFALGKNSPPCAFIMPERIAQTDPFKQITEYTE